MKLNNLYALGLILVLIGGVINWYAYLKISDRRERNNYFVAGMSIISAGVGMWIAESLIKHKLVTT